MVNKRKYPRLLEMSEAERDANWACPGLSTREAKE